MAKVSRLWKVVMWLGGLVGLLLAAFFTGVGSQAAEDVYDWFVRICCSPPGQDVGATAMSDSGADTPQPPVAAPNLSLLFDGIEDFVEIGGSSSLVLTNGFTVAAFVKYEDDSITEESAVVAKHLSGIPAGVILAVWHDPQGVAALNVSGIRIESDLPFGDGEWHHFAGAWDGERFVLFVDGEHEASSVLRTADFAPAADQSVKIGRLDPGLGHFRGSIDEVAVWTRALEEDELRRAMREGARRVPDSLELYYTFDDPDAPGVNVASPGRHHARLVGPEPVLVRR